MRAQQHWNQAKLKLALKLSCCPEFAGNSLCIDSRAVQKGDIFVGLKGQNCDGGVFAAQALAKGAAICIVNKSLNLSHPNFVSVPDTQEALTNMALYKRQYLLNDTKFIGITGSVGKTSTKAIISSLLQEFGKTHATLGNFNNQLGLPLSICNTPEDTDFCVLEMGMSGKGEIAHLAQIAAPDIGLITTITAAHLAYFNTVDEIAMAKLEIYEHMQPGSWAIVNADSNYYCQIKECVQKKHLNMISFGTSSFADINIRSFEIKNNKTVASIAYQNQTIFLEFAEIIGKHLVLNSAAALAVIAALGLDFKQAASFCTNFTPLVGRGSVQLLSNEIVLIDDSYNASPASVKAALQTLHSYKTSSNRTIAILGDMKELGLDSEKWHVELLDEALKIDLVYTVGELMGSLHRVLPGSIHLATSAEVSLMIVEELKRHDIVLVKGSFSMNMSQVVQSICQAFSRKCIDI